MTRNEILQIARPILFNTEMVKAIPDGSKTVTRRLLKPHNAVKAKKCGYEQGNGLWYDNQYNDGDKDTHIKDYSVSCCWIGTKIYTQKYAPYQVGDILYVRETWAPLYPDMHSNKIVGYIYKAEPLSVKNYDERFPNGKDYMWDGKWRPSIHMPKEAARIFLRVTDIRVERLQDITVEQAIKEGTPDVWFNFAHKMKLRDTLSGIDLPNHNFIKIWNSTVKKTDLDKYGWEANPGVWVIEFERVEVK